ncbi:MAG: hypothetical protein ABSD02_14015 [Steroidobacteraceae bacterium]|jgi:hypothetical protein
MHHKQAIAIEIALQTHVLQTCPIHNEIFCNDDVDPSSAFALAVELVRQHTPYVDEFQHNPHALTDLLSETIGAAPASCPVCAGDSREHRGSLAGSFSASLSTTQSSRPELHLA